MVKRFNFRIYPNKIQEHQIQSNFGCVRFVYNYYLAKQIEAYHNNPDGKSYIDKNACCRDVTALKKVEGYTWLADADSNSLHDAISNLDFAYKTFFRNVKKNNVAPGFPKYKSKKDTRKSYKSKNNSDCSSVVLGEKTIKLPKLGLVDCRVSKTVEGRILSATIIQNPSGKYSVSVCFTEVEQEQLPKTGAVIGLHMGVYNLATTSEGENIENYRFYEKSLKKISRLQRQVSRKPSGSNNREKARKKLACAYERYVNQKTDYLQKKTKQFVRDYDVICVRDENLQGMFRDKRFPRSLYVVGWGEFVRQLSYKCDWYGKTFIKIENSHPSTQICSSCGYHHKELVRKNLPKMWDCPKCGTPHNRNINAAKNILNAGVNAMPVAT